MATEKVSAERLLSRLEPHGRTQDADLVTRQEGDQRVPVSDT